MTALTVSPEVASLTAEIKVYKAQTGACLIEIGRRLIRAKELLSHGDWLPWLENEVEFSERTAQRFMKVAENYSNPTPVSDLGMSKALSLLMLPEAEREEFIAQPHEVNGVQKTVAEMSKRELEQLIRERDEAQRKCAALAKEMNEQIEEQRTVYDVDMADARAKLAEAENRAKGYELKLENVNAKAAADLQQADEEARALRAQLEFLQNAPKEVAVETVVDQQAVDSAVQAARKETETKLKAKLEKAEKEKARAEEAKNKAEQDLAALKVAQEESAAIVAQEKQAMADQVQALQKKLAVASSSEMTIFKLHFEQGQGSINKMVECINRMRDAGTPRVPPSCSTHSNLC